MFQTRTLNIDSCMYRTKWVSSRSTRITQRKNRKACREWHPPHHRPLLHSRVSPSASLFPPSSKSLDDIMRWAMRDITLSFASKPQKGWPTRMWSQQTLAAPRTSNVARCFKKSVWVEHVFHLPKSKLRLSSLGCLNRPFRVPCSAQPAILTSVKRDITDPLHLHDGVKTRTREGSLSEHPQVQGNDVYAKSTDCEEGNRTSRGHNGLVKGGGKRVVQFLSTRQGV